MGGKIYYQLLNSNINLFEESISDIFNKDKPYFKTQAMTRACLWIAVLFVAFPFLLVYHFRDIISAPIATFSSRSRMTSSELADNARPSQPCPSGESSEGMYTAEEILYFTTGQGDRLKHEARLR